MHVTATCTCGRSFKFRFQDAGKRVKCRFCGAEIRVPAPGQEPGSSEAAQAPPPQPPPGTRPCPFCSQAIPPDATFCVNCGWDTVQGKRIMPTKGEGESREPGGPPIWFELFGVGFTPRKSAVLAVVVLVVLWTVGWLFNGPLRNTHLASVESVRSVPALQGLVTQELYDLVRGTGSMDLGIRKPGSDPTQGRSYSIGGGERLVLTRPDPEGGHVLMEVGISQRYLVKKGMSSALRLNISEGAFRLDTAEGSSDPILPWILVRGFEEEGEAVVDLASADFTRYEPLMPPGVAPAEQELKTGFLNGISDGRFRYDGSGGVTGEFSFVSFLFKTGEPLARGLMAEGRLERADPSGIGATYEYRGSDLRMSWNKGTSAWWSSGHQQEKEDSFAPLRKLRVALLFQRPPAGSGKLHLWFSGERIGRLARRFEASGP